VAENAGPATITITRSSPLGAASVQLATSDGTATGGVDYTPATLSVQFAPGETSKTVTIAILNDTLVEGDETVNLTLSSVVGLIGEAALGSRTTAILRITDDDTSVPGGPGGPGTPTPSPTPIPPGPGPCNPRQNIQVTARAIGGGRLEATLTAPTVAGITNGLTQIVFNSLQNGNVQLGPGPVSAGATIPLSGAQTVTFVVTRQTAGQATHVAFTVRDSCGDWPSFVGGGPDAF